MKKLIGLIIGLVMGVGVVLMPTSLAIPPKPIQVEKVMSIDKDQLRDLTATVLKMVDAACDTKLYSEDAVEQLMLTAAAESNLGEYLHQIGGVATGVYQMEPATVVDIITNYVAYRPKLQKAIEMVAPAFGIDNVSMMGSIPLQIIMTRIHYLRVKEALPSREDINGMDKYHKVHYNTNLGKATVKETIEKYNRYVVEA
jgi:hypothetical protein